MLRVELAEEGKKAKLKAKTDAKEARNKVRAHTPHFVSVSAGARPFAPRH